MTFQPLILLWQENPTDSVLRNASLSELISIWTTLIQGEVDNGVCIACVIVINHW